MSLCWKPSWKLSGHVSEGNLLKHFYGKNLLDNYGGYSELEGLFNQFCMSFSGEWV